MILGARVAVKVVAQKLRRMGKKDLLMSLLASLLIRRMAWICGRIIFHGTEGTNALVDDDDDDHVRCWLLLSCVAHFCCAISSLVATLV